MEDVAASSMAVWYQITGVNGGGSPIMETITLNIETDYLAGISEELDQSKDLKTNPILYL